MTGLNDLESLLAEGRDDPLGEHRSDAPHHAGAEIFLDPLRGRRRRGLEEVGLELEPVSPVSDPDADSVDELPGGDRGDVPHDRHKDGGLPRAFTFKTAKPLSSCGTSPARRNRRGCPLGGVKVGEGCKRGSGGGVIIAIVAERPSPADVGKTVLDR